MNKVVSSAHELENGNYKTYVIGYALSVVLTLTAYLLVVNHAISSQWGLAMFIAGLALIQAVVQLTLFLHLGHEAKPRFKLLVFGFMLTVILILIGGSIWIMHNLNYRQMSPQYINNYMNSQDGGL